MPSELKVISIAWDRVHLTLSVQADRVERGDPQFALATPNQLKLVDSVEMGAGRYDLRMNVTNFQNRQQIPDGTWRVVQLDAGTPAAAGDPAAVGQVAGYDLRRLSDLDAASRIFIYDGNKTSYTVSFGISDGDGAEFLIRVYQFFRSSKEGGPAPKAPWQRRIRQRILPQSRRVELANRWYRIARRLNPPDGKRILFASEMRLRMEGNLLRVHDRMVERGLDQQYRIRTSFRVPKLVTKKGTLRLIYLLATSDIVIIDDYFGILGALRVDPGTKIIQAWHAGSGFKSIGYSRFGNYGSPKLSNAHRKYTYAITGSRHLVPVYAEAFGIEERSVIATGLPRIDTFLDPRRAELVVEQFHQQYPQTAGKKLILFAPTFRGRGVTDAHYEYDRIDFERFHQLCGEQYVVGFRMHHFVRSSVPIPAGLTDRLIDLTSYPDTNDLLHATDVLITDYSSIIYEFSLLDRPMLFFAYDKELYSATRGFHRDFDSTAPGRICETFDELVKAIVDGDYRMERIAAFRAQNFDVVDTNSADRFIDTLILSDPVSAESELRAQSDRVRIEQGMNARLALKTVIKDDSGSDEDGGAFGI